MLKKLVTLAVALVAAAGSAYVSTADAKPGHGDPRPGFHHYRGYRYYGPVVPVYPLVSACSYERSMWRRTGSRYWRARYYDCMDW